MNRDGFALVDALLSLVLAASLAASVGTMTVSARKDEREAREWSNARLVAVNEWEQSRIRPGGERRVEIRDGTVYRIERIPQGDWYGVPIQTLVVSWEGVGGHRELAWTGACGP